MAEAKSRTFYIYCHTSPSGKRYIGQTRNKPRTRWGNGRGYINNQYFHRAIEKYGWENFDHSILMVCHTKQMANLLEVRLIARFGTTNRDAGYNIADGGDGPTGVKWDEERKKTRSERISGEGNPMYGRHHSPEAIALMSKNRSGRQLSDEEREKKTAILLESNMRRRKAVNQYDLDGNLVATYTGFVELEEETGFNHSTVLRVCQGKGNTAYGFKWEYADDELRAKADEVRNKRTSNSMPVIQYDLDGNEVARFASLTEAQRETGIHRDRIGDCCCGGLSSYGGFVWKYDKRSRIDRPETPVVQFDLSGNEVSRFSGLTEASERTGIPRYLIRNCCRGKSATSHGYKWRFASAA